MLTLPLFSLMLRHFADCSDIFQAIAIIATFCQRRRRLLFIAAITPPDAIIAIAAAIFCQRHYFCDYAITPHYYFHMIFSLIFAAIPPIRHCLSAMRLRRCFADSMIIADAAFFSLAATPLHCCHHITLFSLRYATIFDIFFSYAIITAFVDTIR